MNSKKIPVLLSIFSLLLLLVPSVAAQTSTIVPGTITVTGEGMASAPAETASVIIVLGADSNVYIDPMTTVPDGATTPMPVNLTTVDPTAVIDAIVASGVPAEDVQIIEPVFQGEWGSGMPSQPVTIFVAIAQPSVEGLSALLELARTTSAAEGLFVNQFSVMYGVSDCRALQQAARVDAVAQARMNAEDQATAMETTIGNAVASRDTMPTNMGFYQPSGCNAMPNGTPYAVKMGAPQFDPSQPAEVTVYVAVEVSFDIP